MLQTKTMKKKIAFAVVLFGLLLSFIYPSAVHAAANPLKNIPKKVSCVLNTAPLGMGCEYFTPEYSTKVKLKVKSSNPKVLTVKAYEFRRNNNKYSAGYETRAVAPGKATLTITATINKKTYKATSSYTVYKWQCPVKSIKIGSKDYTSKLKKGGALRLKNQKSLSGKFTYKLDSNFKLVYAAATGDYGMKNIKNGQKLPNKTRSVIIKAQSKKTKEYYTIRIYYY